ncbi:BRISC and BRCA1-A complex member 1-like [Saccoglossus kowalevskii]|uniref:BRISC and BRCA1-A complex member 1 n=1 Tax=Saccoglossus kowalevskii TaxID=10224 RepID=A0ABM0GYG8_SACKO|nr:PREDICTED: BRISC and BRCA1-A complex member 1-like [Saccoglossus kowalevskii]
MSNISPTPVTYEGEKDLTDEQDDGSDEVTALDDDECLSGQQEGAGMLDAAASIRTGDDIPEDGIQQSEVLDKSDEDDADGNTDSDPESLLPVLPKVNCPEKIVICLDLSSEMNTIPFMSKDGTKYPPLQMVKRAINIFVHTKTAINRQHEFALVVLQDNALWMHNFTSNTEEFCYVLADLNNDSDIDTFDMSSLFDLIYEKVDLPPIKGNIEIIPPPYIVRTIMIYGRSNCVPEFHSGQETQKILMQSPYFFMDIFYIHEAPAESNYCEEIFDSLCELDEGGKSFVFEVGRNPTYLHDNMAKLVAHPLQRPLQRNINYKLNHEIS